MTIYLYLDTSDTHLLSISTLCYHGGICWSRGLNIWRLQFPVHVVFNPSTVHLTWASQFYHNHKTFPTSPSNIMISKAFLQAIVALGLLKGGLALMTQAEANAICNRRSPGYIAVMRPDGSNWGGCVPVSIIHFVPEKSEVSFTDSDLAATSYYRFLFWRRIYRSQDWRDRLLWRRYDVFLRSTCLGG